MSTTGTTSTKNIAETYERFSKYFEKKDKTTFSTDEFFKLLMAEMSNQDPLEPMSNTEFVSQLANYTALKTQQDALYYQNANYAQSLVGKTVTVASMDLGKFGVETGIVTSMNLSEGEFFIKVNGKSYSMSQIMEVMPLSNPYAVSGADGAYATSLIGKKVTVVAQNAIGQQISETGIVTHIENRDNVPHIIVKDLAYPLSSVVKIENAAKEDIDEEEEFSGSGSSGTTATTPTTPPPPPDTTNPTITATGYFDFGTTAEGVGIQLHFAAANPKSDTYIEINLKTSGTGTALSAGWNQNELTITIPEGSNPTLQQIQDAINTAAGMKRTVLSTAVASLTAPWDNSTGNDALKVNISAVSVHNGTNTTITVAAGNANFANTPFSTPLSDLIGSTTLSIGIGDEAAYLSSLFD